MGWVLALKDYLAVPMTAEATMQRYADTGSPALLAKLYEEHGNDLYYYLLSLSDPDTAADIAQRTWVRVIEKRHLYQRSGRFSAWLFTLGRNQLMDEFRRTQRLDVDSDKAHQGQDQHLRQAVESAHQDVLPDFALMLAALPFEQREALALQQQGFGLQEIANITHNGVETIKSRLRYAKKRLKDQLESHDE